ncbi:MAG: ExbD/TolR family protein [Planctomycetota bacterium]
MNMTPMIDIVFLLIIFFMTVSQVSEVNRERLKLPEQPGSQDQEASVLTINFLADGSIVVGGANYGFSELIGLVADELTRLGDDPTRLTVVLRADRDVASGVVNRVVEALAQMDIRKVRFPVQVPEQ